MTRKIFSGLGSLSATALMVVIAGFSVPATVRADDTEVFFPDSNITSVGTIHPNILFIIDDSGSMKTVDAGETDSRLVRVQTAFRTVMDEIGADTNVGLMRFSNTQGGPVLFPVSPVESLIKDVDPSFARINEVAVIAAGQGSEAQQTGTAVAINPSPIYFGSPSVKDFTVAQEAKQNGTATNCNVGCSKTISAPLELIKTDSVITNTTSQWVGLRFANIDLPTDFVATDARLVFTAYTNDDDPVDLRIYGHKNNQSVPFSSSPKFNVASSDAAGTTAAPANTVPKGSARTPTTETRGLEVAGYIPWSDVPPVDQADLFASPNLSDLVNEIKNCRTGATPCATDWSVTASNNALTFMITGDNSPGKGRRQAQSLKSGPANASKLQVAYTSSAMPEKVITGLRFASVQIPRGVKITDAFLNFHQDALGGAGNLKLRITVEASDDAAPYAATVNNISGRGYAGSATASWQMPDWNSPFGVQNSSAADIKALLNQITGRAGWCGGQAIAFKIEVESGDMGAFRRAFSSAMSGDYAPSLSYSYATDDAALENGCASRQPTSVQINTGNDDGEENPIGNAPVLSAANLNLGASSKAASIVGMRFSKVNLPVGAIIQSAVIDFTASATTATAASFTIYGQDSGNAPALITDKANLKNRRDSQKVSATVNWSPASWSSGTGYTSPELGTIVQKIVDNKAWSPGNAMVFLIDGSGTRSATSYNGKPSAAPKLRITYQTRVGKLTVRNYLKTIVNQLTPYSWTPSVGTLYEAARYYRGEAAYYGRTRGFGDTLPANPSTSDLGTARNLNVSHPSTFVNSPRPKVLSGCLASDPTSPACATEHYEGSTIYKSPITDSCQGNSMVFLTDGYPNYNDAIPRVQAMTGVKSCKSISLDSSKEGKDGGTCAEELSEFMFTHDQSASLSGVQSVRTYTIGFSFPDAKDWLTAVAIKGGGAYYEATSAAELVSAFRSIVARIIDTNTTFVAPAVTVNNFNRLTHRNELYFAVFRPSTEVAWPGNLKRYQLFQSPSDAAPRIYDAGNNPAVDSNTGFFMDNARSFWSAAADGAEVQKGGAASVLTADRKILTYTGSAAPSNVDLTLAAHKLIETNALITKSMLGLPAAATDDERANLLKWARGIDVLDENGDGSITDARKSIGDPLHSEPQLIAYGGTDASPDISIFMSDNQGYLHAFNATDGTEQFAFIPQELLPNLNAFFTGSGGYVNRPYGMDGPITAWVNDANNNGRILNNGTPEAGEFVYLYAGMRRGGSNYYALDVTDRSKPLLKFAIKGGTGAYAELGQTWSRAIRAKIRIGGADKDVLIFSGGYDPDVDRGVDSAITESSRGRALFVADARTGALLWWASSNSGASVVVPEMKYSIPASPRAIDLDGDGRVDRIYLADTGGQVFRVVLGKDGDGIPSLSKASISRIAALAGTTAKSARRFYATPDIALITKGVGKPFLSVSLGSGFHEHPLAQVNDDRFYILRDPELDNESVCKTGDTDCTPLFIGGDSDLYDATANLAGSSDATATKKAKVDIAAKQGLYIRLTDSAGSLTGEKVMSDATTFEGQVLFTTYQPGAAAGNPCAAITGLSRLYQISVTDATPVQPLNQAPDTLNDGSLTLTREDRSRSLKQGGLPPNPTILFPAISSRIASDGSRKVCTGSACLPDQVLACVGAECFPPGIKIETVKTFWQDLEE